MKVIQDTVDAAVGQLARAPGHESRRKASVELRVPARGANEKQIRFGTVNIYFENKKLLDTYAYAYSMIYTIPAMFLNGLALYFVMLAFGVPLSPECRFRVKYLVSPRSSAGKHHLLSPTGTLLHARISLERRAV